MFRRSRHSGTPEIAPIRTMYHFRLWLTEHFVGETLRLGPEEYEHLKSQLSISPNGPWSALRRFTVSVLIEDWRSHLAFKISEGKHPPNLGPDWVYELREHTETVYAHEFDSDPLVLWRVYLSRAQEEVLSLDIAQYWDLRLHAQGGRFPHAVPDPCFLPDQNKFLQVPFRERDLQKYLFEDQESGWVSTEWQKHYKVEDWQAGIAWWLKVTDLQRYLETQD